MVEVMAEPELTRAAPLRPAWALASAIVAGLLLLTAFPPIGLWWTAPLGVAVFAVATHRRSVLGGAGLGLLTGLAFLLPLLAWTGLHVGAVWLFLPVVEAAYVALLGAAAAWTSPVADRWRWSWPVLTGTLWVGQEALRDRTPFGGFPWGRLAFSQGDAPLLRLAAIGGAPLVTFGVAAVGGLVAAAVVPFVPGPSTPGRAGVRAAALCLGAAALAVLTPLAVPGTTATGRTVTVAIVQGNVPRLGLDFNAQRRAVLDNHVDATLALAQRVAAGRSARPDLVIWPENASDIDPLLNADARDRIDAAAGAIGVPILVGGLLEGPGNRVRNVGLVWLPGTGPAATYVKRHPVPFAEYMPLRPIARRLTDKVDLVQSDFVAGPVPGVLVVGPAKVGDVICFEVAYDNVVRDTVTGGAQLLVVQTNNATFNVAEARQQLAMVQLRAVEHGRPALMASTVGVSAFVNPAGEVLDATRFNQPAVIVRELHLSSARTMATAVGVAPELGLVAVAIAALVTATVLNRARRVGSVP